MLYLSFSRRKIRQQLILLFVILNNDIPRRRRRAAHSSLYRKEWYQHPIDKRCYSSAFIGLNRNVVQNEWYPVDSMNIFYKKIFFIWSKGSRQIHFHILYFWIRFHCTTVRYPSVNIRIITAPTPTTIFIISAMKWAAAENICQLLTSWLCHLQPPKPPAPYHADN